VNNGIFAKYTGIPIIVVPDSKKQNRTHRKKRINKKWAKRYGYTTYNFIEDDKVIMMNGRICVNPRTYYKLKSLELYT
jgi:hypothetical protein